MHHFPVRGPEWEIASSEKLSCNPSTYATFTLYNARTVQWFEMHGTKYKISPYTYLHITSASAYIHIQAISYLETREKNIWNLHKLAYLAY